MRTILTKQQVNTSLDEAHPDTDIITIGCEDQLQKRNRLKGLAMQKLVLQVMENKKDNDSVSEICDVLTNHSDDYYIVDTPFKIDKNTLFRKWEYIHINRFEDYLEIWVREEIIDKTWKVCDHCGQRIKAGEQFSRKCWKCKKGWFHFASEKLPTWKLLTMGSKDRMVHILLDRGFLKPATIKKRLDFFRYNKGVFEIYEARNKEDTGLSTLDLRKTLIYPFIIHNSGYKVEKFILVYNGQLTDELLREIRKGYGRNFPFKIELRPVGDYLKKNGLRIKTVRVSYDDGQYEYEFVKGFRDKIVIDLTNL